MTQQDLFYRAFNNYKQHTKTNLDCVRFQSQAQSLRKPENESLTAIFSSCTIDEDWIEAIERGIPFILKAIKEERQFIRNDGEVTPIEKVRKTSKYSIQDLAKHSNYISHEAPDHLNADIIPDKVLVVQKENDYTVYENRVLYATLLYLQEFVASRLNKIKEHTNKYEATATINKHLIVGNRSLDFKMDLNEIIKDDPYAIKRNKYQDLINRIQQIYANVVTLIKMPIMVECSKVDVATRPITKTNVLRMNRNFRESLALFDFVAEYDKPGYTVSVIEKSFNPLSLPITFDYAEIINLASFITYMHVNGLTDELKKNYDEEEKRLKKEEEDKLLAKAKKIENTATAQGKTLTEYLMILQEAYKILNTRNEELETLMAEKEKTHALEIENINNKHEVEIIDLNHKHSDEIHNLHEQHADEIDALNKNHQEEIATINLEHEDEIRDINLSHNEEINNLKNEINNKNLELDKTIKEYEEKLQKIIEENEKAKNQILDETNNQLNEYKIIKEKAEAELLAIRLKDGLKIDPNDFTTEQRFDELEREKKYLDEFYKKAWKETKKQIRKTIMAEKPKKLIKNSNPKKKKNKKEDEILNEDSILDEEVLSESTTEENITSTVETLNEDKEIKEENKE